MKPDQESIIEKGIYVIDFFLILGDNMCFPVLFNCSKSNPLMLFAFSLNYVCCKKKKTNAVHYVK